MNIRHYIVYHANYYGDKYNNLRNYQLVNVNDTIYKNISNIFNEWTAIVNPYYQNVQNIDMIGFMHYRRIYDTEKINYELLNHLNLCQIFKHRVEDLPVDISMDKWIKHHFDYWDMTDYMMDDFCDVVYSFPDIQYLYKHKILEFNHPRIFIECESFLCNYNLYELLVRLTSQYVNYINDKYNLQFDMHVWFDHIGKITEHIKEKYCWYMCMRMYGYTMEFLISFIIQIYFNYIYDSNNQLIQLY